MSHITRYCLDAARVPSPAALGHPGSEPCRGHDATLPQSTALGFPSAKSTGPSTALHHWRVQSLHQAATTTVTVPDPLIEKIFQHSGEKYWFNSWSICGTKRTRQNWQTGACLCRSDIHWNDGQTTTTAFRHYNKGRGCKRKKADLYLG